MSPRVNPARCASSCTSVREKLTSTDCHTCSRTIQYSSASSLYPTLRFRQSFHSIEGEPPESRVVLFPCPVGIGFQISDWLQPSKKRDSETCFLCAYSLPEQPDFLVHIS